MKRKRLSWFTRAAEWASRTSGRPTTVMVALGVILVWAITGPIFQFSDTSGAGQKARDGLRSKTSKPSRS